MSALPSDFDAWKTAQPEPEPCVIKCACGCGEVIADSEGNKLGVGYQLTSLKLPEEVRKLIFVDDQCAWDWLVDSADWRDVLKALGGEKSYVLATRDDGVETMAHKPRLVGVVR